MWYCGDIIRNIPPLKLLSASDVKHIKGGKQKISNMKNVVKHVERAATLVNLQHLVVHEYTPRAVLDLYNGIKHMFAFPSLSKTHKRRLEQINWKTYYNILSKRKGRLYGEVQTN